eukprot:2675511-Pleurochrysis_carterae.AAC.1
MEGPGGTASPAEPRGGSVDQRGGGAGAYGVLPVALTAETAYAWGMAQATTTTVTPAAQARRSERHGQ